MIKRDANFLIEWAKSLSSIQKELSGVPNNNIVKEQNKFKKIHQGKN